MASTVIQPLADTLKGIITGLSVTPTVLAYTFGPRELDRMPAAVIQPPDIDRTEAGAPESQLGSNDWRLDFPVVFYFDLSEPVAAQTQAVEVVEKFIVAVDANRSLSDPTVLDATVDEGRFFVIDNESPMRPQVAYECRVRLVKFVAPSP